MELPGSADDGGDGVDLTLSLAVGGNASRTAEARSGDRPGDWRRGTLKQAEDRRRDVASAADMAALQAKMLQTRARDRAQKEAAAATGDLCKSGRGVDEENDRTGPRISHSSTPNARANPFGRSPLPVMYPFQAQYVAVPRGYGVACVMPCWGPATPAVADGLRRFEGNVYRPVAGSVTSSCPSTACSNVSKGMESIEVDVTGSNSSEISSHRSEPILGGSRSSSSSSDSKSNSNSGPWNGGEVKKPDEAPLPERGTDELVPDAVPSRISITEPSDSLKKISTELLRMPRVSTTGDGPNGRTINGFLHTRGKSEIKIVCVCHGSSFTPAEFVKHAGGTNVSQALRQIVMVRC